MDLARLNLEMLTSLEVLLDEGSIPGAAARLARPPREVHAEFLLLQELFGDLLLLDGGGLTPRAVALLPELRAGLRALRAVTETPAPFLPTPSSPRTFRIAASHHYRLLALPALLAALPESITLEVVSLSQARHEDLAHGVLDVALGTMEQVPQGALERVALWGERRVCLVPEDALPLDLAAFCARPHVRLGGGGGVDVVGRVLANRSRRRRVCLILPDPAGIAAVVRHTGAVAVLPERLAAQFADWAPGVAVCEPPLALPGMGIYLFWHVQHTATPEHQWLRERIQQSVPAPLGLDIPPVEATVRSG